MTTKQLKLESSNMIFSWNYDFALTKLLKNETDYCHLFLMLNSALENKWPNDFMIQNIIVTKSVTYYLNVP